MKKSLFILGALMLSVVSPVFAATLNVPSDHATIQAAINVANPGDVVVLQNDMTVTSQITITTNGVSLDGDGHTLTADFVKTSNSNNSAIGVQADDVTISDIILDGVNPVVNQLHGINFYEASNGSVDGVTAKNFRTGIAFNSSDGNISNVSTMGNIWHGINVDTRTTQIASVIISGINTHNEATPTTPHIYIDDRSDGTTVSDLNNKYVFFDVGIGRAYFIDIIKPTASFVTPVLNKVFSGASVPVTLNVADNYQIRSVVINIKNASGGHLGTCYNSGSVLASTLTANCAVNISSYADGKYELRAGILDSSGMIGNRLTTSTFFFVDKSKPTVAITTPINGAAVKGTFVVTGSANDAISGIEKVLYTITKIDAIGGSYVANISDGMANGTGVWDFSVTGLTDGFYRLKVQAFDNGGNWRYKHHDVQVDTTKPVTTVDSPTDGSSFDADFTVNINSTDTGSAIAKVVANLYGPLGLIGPCTNQTINPVMGSVDFTCDVDVDALADAAYYIKTNAVDTAGNLSNTVTWNFLVTRELESICGNSILDEGEECDDGEQGSETCTSECTDIVISSCVPTAEVCNGLDDDCNELVDDGILCGGGDGDGDGDGDVCTDEYNAVISVPATTNVTSPVSVGTVSVGDMLTVTVATDDTWSAGDSDDPYDRESNADGLDAYDLYGDFKYGSLVGRINEGSWFLVGTDFSVVVSEAGTFELAYWDSTYDDNSGEVSVTVIHEYAVECPEDSYCGDGVVDEGEECDDGGYGYGYGYGSDNCNDACEWVGEEEPTCGDGIVNQESEQCDDGNENNSDSCTNACQNNTPGGGGQASSIGPGGGSPSSLLETGPDSDPETLLETGPQEATAETVILACEEDTYILERLKKLSALDMVIVKVIPSKYARKLGTKALTLSAKLTRMLLAAKDTEARNELIRAFVCRIEMLKEKRGLRHEHIGADSGGDEVDYLLQYLQDLAILQFVK